jgi:hypothetical protein
MSRRDIVWCIDTMWSDIGKMVGLGQFVWTGTGRSFLVSFDLDAVGQRRIQAAIVA